MALLAMPGLALADNGANLFFCAIAQNFKSIIGTAILSTFVLWAIDHLVGSAKVHDAIIKAGVVMLVLSVATTVIAKGGFAIDCAF